MWLIKEGSFERLRQYFSKLRGKPRVDDRRVISGIAYVLYNGLQWKDVPKEYGPYKTLYNRFVRWRRLECLPKFCRNYPKEGRGF